MSPGQREWTSYLVRPGEKSEAVVGTRTKIYTKEKDPKPHGRSMTPTKNLEEYKTRCGRLEASNARRGQGTSAGNTDETLRSVVANVAALGWWRWHETAEQCRLEGSNRLTTSHSSLAPGNSTRETGIRCLVSQRCHIRANQRASHQQQKKKLEKHKAVDFT